MRIHPGSRNTVPDELRLSIDLRHPDAAELAAMVAQLGERVAASAAAARVDARVESIWRMPPTRFDARLIATSERACDALGYARRRIVSGAGHDSLYVARFAPTAMIFVACRDGLSHNEAEDARPTDLEAGANVLLQSVLAVAEAEER